MSRALLDSSMIFLAVMALISALLALRAVPVPHRIVRSSSDEMNEIFGATLAAVAITTLLTGHLVDLVPIALLFLNIAALLRYYVKRLSMPGVLWITTQPLMMVISSFWAVLFLYEAQLPFWVEGLGFVALGFALIVWVLGFMERLARESILTHEKWARPITPPLSDGKDRHHKVSLQLPCYAEPPEVVMETMDRLAVQDYPHYEVIVIDNNTPDEALWRPLEAHCARLNEQMGRDVFRFFHVAPLAGAKAGALNYCMNIMAPDADIVAVVDADYLARPDFLSKLVPFFDDPKLAYVQTPHDYFGYEGSDYLTACYWEYMPNNKVDMPGVSEYGGGFTIGTMCLIRTEALREVGGWAEWCLTEDSEVSVRLRAAGYHGYYLGETFGRGLIPDTFDDYKKQRFRWTAGPVQQLRRYWRLFMPAPLAPRLPGWTKLLEILRCVAPLRVLAGMIGGLIAMAATSVALLSGAMEPVDLPNIVWLMMALGTATMVLRTWHRYRLSGCVRMKDMIHGEIARLSLSYTILVGGIAGLSSKPLAWRRTPKFAVAETKETPFTSTMIETTLGGIALFLGLLALIGHDVLGGEFSLLLFIGMLGISARFLSAPYMAALFIRHVNGEKAGAGEGEVPEKQAAVKNVQIPQAGTVPALQGARPKA